MGGPADWVGRGLGAGSAGMGVASMICAGAGFFGGEGGCIVPGGGECGDGVVSMKCADGFLGRERRAAFCLGAGSAGMGAVSMIFAGGSLGSWVGGGRAG